MDTEELLVLGREEQFWRGQGLVLPRLLYIWGSLSCCYYVILCHHAPNSLSTSFLSLYVFSVNIPHHPHTHTRKERRKRRKEAFVALCFGISLSSLPPQSRVTSGMPNPASSSPPLPTPSLLSHSSMTSCHSNLKPSYSSPDDPLSNSIMVMGMPLGSLPRFRTCGLCPSY